jgi:glycosyltransferase involved in cell wall biosynthesis
VRIAVWHNLPSGGAKRALYDHVRGLVDRGHTLESWCPPTADQNYLPLSDLIPEHIVPATPEPESAPYSLSNLFSLRTFNLATVRELDRYAQLCAAEINAGDFDLLFANSSAVMAVSTISRYVSIPKVLYLQEPSRWLYEARPQMIWAGQNHHGSWWKPSQLNRALRDSVRFRGYRIQAREEWLSAQAFDRILVNSFFSRESVLRTYGVDATVCYLGVNTDKFVQRDLAKENYVVGLGAIAEHKNVRLAIEALALLPEPRPRLVWIGNDTKPEYLKEVEELARLLRVDFKPVVSIDDDTLVDILNRAQLLVYTPRLEPFGFAPLEANACGLPVVAVAEGGVRETVRDGVNGILVEHDPQAVGTAISYLIKHPAEAARMGQDGRRLVAEDWSVASAVERLEKNLVKAVDAAQQRRQGKRDVTIA